MVGLEGMTTYRHSGCLAECIWKRCRRTPPWNGNIRNVDADGAGSLSLWPNLVCERLKTAIHSLSLNSVTQLPCHAKIRFCFRSELPLGREERGKIPCESRKGWMNHARLEPKDYNCAPVLFSKDQIKILQMKNFFFLHFCYLIL